MLKGHSYSERLKKLSLPTLTYRCARGDMIEVYKILNIYDKQICPNLPLNNKSTRGHCYNFTLRVTDILNSLPVSVTAETQQSFTNHLDKAWCKLEFK